MTSASFLAAFAADYPENPFNYAERIVGKACVDMEPSPQDPDGEVYLAFIRSLEPGTGAASAALRKVLELADDHKVTVRLLVHPIKSGVSDRSKAFSKTKLIQWYQRCGFDWEYSDIRRGYMLRKPEGASK